MPDPVSVTFLGGLGEIGRNCACIEVEGRIMLLDCGLMFPDVDMLGIDLVLPDFTYLRENADRIDGCIATHGHEDHVGGLSFLLRELRFPIYGSALTLGLARNRIEEAGLLDRTELIPVADGERRMIGPFDVEFIPVTHSVPHGFATAFHTPQGTILHTGDFKLDLTPGRRPPHRPRPHRRDRQDDGIRLLLSDSTNADEPGHARSERAVGKVLYDLFHAHEGRRIVIACFASHIHRVQQIVDAAARVRPHDRHDRHVDEEERAAGALDGPAHHPREQPGRHRRRRRHRSGQGVRHLDRFAGRADVGAVADGVERQPVDQDRPRPTRSS